MKKAEQRNLEKEKQVLLEELSKTREEMAAALNQLEEMDEPELQDYFTYMHKAKLIKYNYLIKKVKEIYVGLKEK